MNIQSGRRSPRRAVPAAAGGGALGEKIGTVVKVLFLVAVAAVIFNCYIYLNQRIGETEREMRRTRAEIDQVTRELVLLRNRCESLSSWSNISARIRRFNLGLRPAEPGQERTIALLSPAQAAAVHPEHFAVNRQEQPRVTGGASLTRR